MSATVIDPHDLAITTEQIIALQRQVRDLAAERGAVILAHNYQRPEVQDVADFVGDSLGLSRQAAAIEADVIAVLRRAFHGRDGEDPRARTKRVLPDLAAGCSLADTITAAQLRGGDRGDVRQHLRRGQGRDGLSAPTLRTWAGSRSS